MTSQPRRPTPSGTSVGLYRLSAAAPRRLVESVHILEHVPAVAESPVTERRSPVMWFGLGTLRALFFADIDFVHNIILLLKTLNLYFTVHHYTCTSDDLFLITRISRCPFIHGKIDVNETLQRRWSDCNSF